MKNSNKEIEQKDTNLPITFYYFGIKFSIVAILIMPLFIYVSYLAEPLVQEVGFSTTMLRGNRDFLVNNRWLFITVAIGSVLNLLLCLKKLRKHNMRLEF